MTRVRPLLNPIARANDAADGWTGLYERVIQALRVHGVANGAPRAGEAFPDFSLPDTAGRYQSLRAICSDGPVIVSFQRGLWCPYCFHEVSTWAAVLPSLSEAGIRLVLVAPEVGDRATALQLLAGEKAIMLCDVDHGVALASGLAFHVGDELRERYLSFGLDLGAIYGSGGWFLPVPATYLIDAGGIVRYANADVDFRVRADPRDVADIAVAFQ